MWELVLGVIMSWRTVVIGSRSKLDFKMNYMIIRKDCLRAPAAVGESVRLASAARPGGPVRPGPHPPGYS